MSAIELSEYFPYDAGPGANSTEQRWRKMARLWAPTGVVSGGFNYSFVGDACTIQPGAVWVGGQYGELTAPVTLGTGPDGWVCFRNDSIASRIELFWYFGGALYPPPDTPTVFYEGLLRRVAGVARDARRYVDRGARGVLNRAQSTQVQTGIPENTWTDLTGLGLTFENEGGARRVRLVAEATFAKSVADGAGQALLAIRTSPGNVEVIRRNVRLESGTEQSTRCEAVLDLSGGIYNYKASAFSFTSWLNTASVPSMPAVIYAEDVGRATFPVS